MIRRRRCKCCHCGQLYQADPRNGYHQRYCSERPCQKASKAASQAAWRATPEGRDYFKGEVNRARVKAWQKAHPGYARGRARTRRALQDDCPAQVLVPAKDNRTLTVRALQELLALHGLVLTALIAQLTGSVLQDEIDATVRSLIGKGQQIQGPGRAKTGQHFQTG